MDVESVADYFLRDEVEKMIQSFRTESDEDRISTAIVLWVTDDNRLRLVPLPSMQPVQVVGLLVMAADFARDVVKGEILD